LRLVPSSTPDLDVHEPSTARVNKLVTHVIALEIAARTGVAVTEDFPQAGSFLGSSPPEAEAAVLAEHHKATVVS
jgi:hypothetical protein